MVCVPYHLFTICREKSGKDKEVVAVLKSGSGKWQCNTQNNTTHVEMSAL